MLALEAESYDDREAEPTPSSSPIRVLSLAALRYRFMDLGIVLLENGSYVDFYRLAKRGPVHPSYGDFFRNMPEPQLHALEKAFASGRFTAMEMFRAFTTGIPSPDVLISVK
jgi:hypothetical protein